MALAKHPSVRLRFGDLLAEARGFTADAWRDCWLPMLLIVAAHVLVFLNQHVARTEWNPGLLGVVTPLLFLAYVPLYGGLYRAAIGGRLFDSLGPGGLQWSALEWRLIAVGVVILFLIGLAATPFLAAMGVAALVMGLKSTVTVGPLGQWARWAPAALAICAIFLWLAGSRIARLALGWPYSVARAKTEPFAGMAPARRSGWVIAFAFLVCQIPGLLAMLAPGLLTMIEPDVLTSDIWPLPEALGTGLMQGLLYAVVQAPLSVGVLAGAYYLLEEAHHGGEAGAEPHGPMDEAELAGAGLAGAAALSAHEAAELDLPPSEVDHAAGGDPAEAEGHEAHAEAGDAEVENDDPPPVHADHTPDPALAGVHPAEPAPETDAAVDEVAAAEHGHDGAPAEEPASHPVDPGHPEDAADSAAEVEAGAVELHPPHAHEADAAHEPEPEIAHEPVPEIVPETPADAAHADAHEADHGHDGIESLSPWPHSVLPPWPTGVNTTLARARLGLPPLASDGEPAHAMKEGERAL